MKIIFTTNFFANHPILSLLQLLKEFPSVIKVPSRHQLVHMPTLTSATVGMSSFLQASYLPAAIAQPVPILSFLSRSLGASWD